MIEPAQQVFGGRTGAAHFAHVVQFLADDFLVEVEEMRALPRLHQGAAEHAMQRRPRDRAPAKPGDDRMHLRRRRRIAQGKIDIVGELSAHADRNALLHHDDILGAGERVAQCRDRKRPERDDDDEADTDALVAHFVDGVLDGAADRAHRDHEHVGVIGAIGAQQSAGLPAERLLEFACEFRNEL